MATKKKSRKASNTGKIRVSKKGSAKHPFKRELLLPQGPHTMQIFLSHYGNMFNLTDIERRCKLASGTLRHIVKGVRPMTWYQYEAVRENVLHIMLEFALILQNYDRQIVQKGVGF